MVMRSIFTICFTLLIACKQPEISSMVPAGLSCEYVVNPSVVDRLHPRLGWINQVTGDFRGMTQTAYQVRVASSESLLATPDLWDSGRVNSGRSNQVLYQGQELTSGQDCWWQVRVWDEQGLVSEWSKPAYWGMGILEATEWQAQWIGAPWQGEEALPEPGWPDAPVEQWPPPAPYFRKEFEVTKKIAQAKAYVTGLGYFEFYINGNKQGDEVLVPNQTNYGKRDYLMETNIPLPDDFEEYKIMYLSYDITDRIKPGKNALGAIVGNGFYNASKYWSGSYGSPRFLGQIHLTYQDGTSEIIVTDDTWKAAKGPILMDMVFYGETYDARLEMPGWSEPDFDESGWQSSAIRDTPFGKLVAHTPYPDKVMEEIKPVSIERLDNGNHLVDFGVEVSGWARLNHIDGPQGQKIALKFISNTPSGENIYILNGSGNESYAPRFNWFVFSEVEVVNWPGELTEAHITAEAVNTYIERTAKFETSNELFNRINQIWQRSQLDNMHGGVASDCPHRERSPYTGDGQVACATVMHNFDARSFYHKWIGDVRGAQIKSTGYVPNCAPWQPGCGGGVAWGAAVCIMPWEYYLHYGSEDILEENYQAMKGYVSYMSGWLDSDSIMHLQRTGRDGEVLKWFNLGEWGCYEGQCPPDEMVHSYFFWKCTDILVKAAAVLGNAGDASAFSRIRSGIQNGFQRRFYDNSQGTFGDHGANVFALDMGVPEAELPRVVSSLKQNLLQNGGHVHTGIYGTRLLFEVLSDHGLNEMAYEALNKTTEPSFGFWLQDGATTTREFWDNTGSHNHPMFGGGLTWFYRDLAGMQTDPMNPGYRHIIFKPKPVQEVSFVKYFNRTVFGDAGIHWQQQPGQFTMDITVPIGSSATVFIPAQEVDQVTESANPIPEAPLVELLGIDESGYLVCKVPSGVYHFKSIRP